MNYLVSGGTGFVGRVLVELLQKQGHSVVVLTRDADKARRLEATSHAQIVTGHDLPGPTLSHLLRDTPPIDGVFHLAANQKYLGPKPLLYRDNVVLTERLLDWATGAKVRRFVYTSTIDVFGPSPTPLPNHSELASCRPRSVYGWAKLQAEQRVSRYGRQHQLETVSLRLGNVYGPGSLFIVVDIARALQRKLADPLYRYYHQIKDRVVHLGYVDDIARGIFAAVQQPIDSGSVINLSGDQPVSIGELFELVATALDLPFSAPAARPLHGLRLQARSLYQWHVKKKADRVTYLHSGHWSMSTAVARAVLNFRPEVSLRDGIARTLAWDASQREATR
ncbi:MAG: NAD(P)-dependent oxidoreductase [Deltaproteobacteria bacterium]|nr:NAD(P)-dependent oxidoreductase [Deltaproteobacteria bacterium]